MSDYLSAIFQLIAQYSRPQLEVEPEADLDQPIRPPQVEPPPFEEEQPLLRVEEALDEDIRNDPVVHQSTTVSLPTSLPTALSLQIVDTRHDGDASTPTPNSEVAVFEADAAWSQDKWLALGFGIGTLIVVLLAAVLCWKVSLTTTILFLAQCSLLDNVQLGKSSS